ncbi:hypothetical protein U1Q18_023193 [Sarracenia purpurea var. burkii]
MWVWAFDIETEHWSPIEAKGDIPDSSKGNSKVEGGSRIVIAILSSWSGNCFGVRHPSLLMHYDSFFALFAFIILITVYLTLLSNQNQYALQVARSGHTVVWGSFVLILFGGEDAERKESGMSEKKNRKESVSNSRWSARNNRIIVKNLVAKLISSVS